MNGLNLGENLTRLRHKKKVTQEQVADFAGVTKASVSKWETRQSTPDIMLLPRLASYFGVSVDELLGYEPQLGKEQIERIYQELRQEFSEKPFEETMEKSRELVKQYYACYPFLFQICVLWLNHCSLAGSPGRQMEILNEMWELCGHIIEECEDFSVCSDTVILQAYAGLLLGKIPETVEALESQLRPEQLCAQSDVLLIEAYLRNHDEEKAEKYAQMSMYQHLLLLMGSAGKYILMQRDNLPKCETTIRRIQSVMEVYEMEKLQPNAALQVYYQAALVYCGNGQKERALTCIRKCVQCMKNLLKTDQIELHGDAYFDRLEEQFEKYGVNENAPRDRSLVVEDIRNFCDNPAFLILQEEPEFILLKKSLQEVQ